jgi:hypothetical protein
MDPLDRAHRYHAACSAAQAAAGQSKDAAEPGPTQRLALRRQALTWLRANLSAWSRLVAAGQVGRSRLARILTRWQKDAALAGLCDAEALKALSTEERQACQCLWADVAVLLNGARPSR